MNENTNIYCYYFHLDDNNMAVKEALVKLGYNQHRPMLPIESGELHVTHFCNTAVTSDLLDEIDNVILPALRNSGVFKRGIRRGDLKVSACYTPAGVDYIDVKIKPDTIQTIEFMDSTGQNGTEEDKEEDNEKI